MRHSILDGDNCVEGVVGDIDDRVNKRETAFQLIKSN